MNLSPDTLFDVCEATWPAAHVWQLGSVTLRDGQGGGKRVSAASAPDVIAPDKLCRAEAEMRQMGQKPLFVIRNEQRALDVQLERSGYQVVDPVRILTMPVSGLTDLTIPRVTAFEIWEPLAIMREIWAAGGIGSARIEVMKRAQTKTGILLRWNEKPAGVAFAAMHGSICMVHAVEVRPQHRRQGVGAWIMRAAAFWAQRQGAETISVLCTRANIGANRLYSTLGFVEVAQYHYRQAID